MEVLVCYWRAAFAGSLLVLPLACKSACAETTTLEVAEDADITSWVNWSAAPRGRLPPRADGGRGGTLRVARQDFPGTCGRNDGWVLLKWNLSPIPKGDGIDKVTLKITQLDSYTDLVDVIGIDQGNWPEVKTTWDNWQAQLTSETRLGTMVSVPSKSDAKDTIFSSPALTARVQGWHDGSLPNLGILLKWAGPAKDGDTFASRESKVAKPARLIIEHRRIGSPRPDHVGVPGVPIAHYPAAVGIYVGSPSLVVLPSGSCLASHDGVGPHHRFGCTYLYRSEDDGSTWQRNGRIVGQGTSTLFTHDGVLYLFGLGSGSVVIRRSTDEGQTWTEPKDKETGLLLHAGRYHTAPTPVIVHDGRIWRAMEDVIEPGRWALDYRAFMMSAPVDSNLLRAESWTSSHRVARDGRWLQGKHGGWLEGNAVVSPAGKIVNVLRVHYYGWDGATAAVVRISDGGKSARFEPESGFIHFPGGAKKFTIRFDPVSKCYWSLTNWMPERHKKNGRHYQGGNAESTRNTLARIRSADLRHWEVRSVVLYHPDTRKYGFQYADWQFDGHDIIAVCRTAFDDGLGGAHSMHDANYLAFHRILDFRREPSTKNPYSGLLEELDR